MLPALARSSTLSARALGRRPQPASSAFRRGLSSQPAVRRYKRKVSGDCAGAEPSASAQPSASGLWGLVARAVNDPTVCGLAFTAGLWLPLYAYAGMLIAVAVESGKSTLAGLDRLSDQFTAQIQLLDTQNEILAGRRHDPSAQFAVYTCLARMTNPNSTRAESTEQ